MAFWLEYWLASYQHLLSTNEGSLNFFNYDSLCQDPQRSLQILAEVLGSCDPEAVIANARRISQPRQEEIALESVPKSLIKEVNNIYAGLREVSIN